MAPRKCKLVFDDGTTYPIEGKLQFSDVTVDANTGSVTLRAGVPQPARASCCPTSYVRAIVEEGTMSAGAVDPPAGGEPRRHGQARTFTSSAATAKLQQREA